MSTPFREELGLPRRPPESSTPATPGSGSRRVPGGVDETRSRQAKADASCPDGAQPHRGSERVPRGRTTPPGIRRDPLPAAPGRCLRHAGRRDTGSSDVIPRQESAMSETPKLLLQKDGPIGWIIFNQPEKRNAVSLEMCGFVSVPSESWR